MDGGPKGIIIQTGEPTPITFLGDIVIWIIHITIKPVHINPTFFKQLSS